MFTCLVSDLGLSFQNFPTWFINCGYLNKTIKQCLWFYWVKRDTQDFSPSLILLNGECLNHLDYNEISAFAEGEVKAVNVHSSWSSCCQQCTGSTKGEWAWGIKDSQIFRAYLVSICCILIIPLEHLLEDLQKRDINYCLI